MTLSGADADGLAVSARAARLSGDARQARLQGSPAAPVRLGRGPLALDTAHVEARLSDDGQVLALDLPGWSGTLPVGDEATAAGRGGQLSLRVDVPSLRGATPDAASEATLRQVLLGAEARGGLSLKGDTLRVEADEARFDRERGQFTLTGSPASVARELGGGWSRSQGRELILTLE